MAPEYEFTVDKAHPTDLNVIATDLAGNEWRFPKTTIATGVQIEPGKRLLVTTEERRGKKPDQIIQVAQVIPLSVEDVIDLGKPDGYKRIKRRWKKAHILD